MKGAFDADASERTTLLAPWLKINPLWSPNNLRDEENLEIEKLEEARLHTQDRLIEGQDRASTCRPESGFLLIINVRIRKHFD